MKTKPNISTEMSLYVLAYRYEAGDADRWRQSADVGDKGSSG